MSSIHRTLKKFSWLNHYFGTKSQVQDLNGPENANCPWGVNSYSNQIYDLMRTFLFRQIFRFLISQIYT